MEISGPRAERRALLLRLSTDRGALAALILDFRDLLAAGEVALTRLPRTVPAAGP